MTLWQLVIAQDSLGECRLMSRATFIRDLAALAVGTRGIMTDY